MIRRTNGSFPSTGTSDTIYAKQATTSQAQWTQGSTFVHRLDSNNIQPSTNDRARLLGFAITGSLSITRLDFATPPFGKFGKILAGVITDEPIINTPQVAPALALPPDLTAIFTIWDPANDPLPPTNQQALVDPTGLQLQLSQTPPQPIPLPRGGTSLGVGIWMLPSLLAASSVALVPEASLQLVRANWTITYDDGY